VARVQKTDKQGRPLCAQCKMHSRLIGAPPGGFSCGPVAKKKIRKMS